MSDKSQYSFDEFGLSEYGGAVVVTESASTGASVTSTLNLDAISTESGETQDSFTMSTLTEIGSTEYVELIGGVSEKLLESADGFQSESGSLAITVNGPANLVEVATATTSAFSTFTSQLELSDTVLIEEFGIGDSPILGVVTPSPIAADVPIYESPTISFTEVTDIYNRIYIAERPDFTASHSGSVQSSTFAAENVAVQYPPVYSTADTAQATESGRSNWFPPVPRVLDTGIAVEDSDLTGTGITNSTSEAITIEDLLVSVQNWSVGSDAGSASESPEVSAQRAYQLSGSSTSFVVPNTLWSAIGFIPGDTTIAGDGGSQTKHVGVANTETTTAQPVVAMSAGVGSYNTETADGLGSAKTSFPFDSRADAYGSSRAKARLRAGNDIFLGDRSPVESEINNIYISGYPRRTGEEYTESVEAPFVFGSLDALATAWAEASVAARTSFPFDPLVDPHGSAFEGEYTGDLLSTEIPEIRPYLSGIATARESGSTTGSPVLFGDTRAFGFDRANSVTELTMFTLEGSAGVQTEILTHLIETIGQMSAIGDSYSEESASATTESEYNTNDEGVAAQSDISISESVTFSESESGEAFEESDTTDTVNHDLSDYGRTRIRPTGVGTSQTTIIDETGSGYDSATIETPHSSKTVERGIANGEAVVVYNYDVSGDKIESVPITASLSVFQGNTVSLAADRGLVSPNLSVSGVVTSSSSERADIVENAIIQRPVVVRSVTTIPGLRRTLQILGVEKEFIYSRSVGARRDVEVGDPSDLEIEVGPLYSVEITSDEDKEIIVGPEREVEVSQSDS